MRDRSIPSVAGGRDRVPVEAPRRIVHARAEGGIDGNDAAAGHRQPAPGRDRDRQVLLEQKVKGQRLEALDSIRYVQCIGAVFEADFLRAACANDLGLRGQAKLCGVPRRSNAPRASSSPTIRRGRGGCVPRTGPAHRSGTAPPIPPPTRRRTSIQDVPARASRRPDARSTAALACSPPNPRSARRGKESRSRAEPRSPG